MNHLGLELDSDEELNKVYKRIQENNIESLEEKGAHCCYSESDKYWVLDPQGIPWENFHSLGDIPIYGINSNKDVVESVNSCCVSGDVEKSQTNCC